MPYKNMMEDIVRSTIDNLIADKKLDSSYLPFIDDISAYVLNRVPPKYITSDRGILHGKLDSRMLFQQKADIIIHIYDAVEFINKRRLEPSSGTTILKSEKLYFFPHVIGEVLEETTFSMIPGVSVLLLHNGKPAVMMDDGWDNPFITNKSTKAYYHFWPAFTDDMSSLNKDNLFEIVITHPKFTAKNIAVNLPVVEAMDLSKSKAVQIALIQLHEGEDPSFLFED